MGLMKVLLPPVDALSHIVQFVHLTIFILLPRVLLVLPIFDGPSPIIIVLLVVTGS